MKKTRREFLGAAGSLAASALLGAQDARKPLAPTEDNIEGPYYRKDAPFRSRLADGVKGDALVISGRVLTPDGSPLREALVDVWHASAEGEYDHQSAKFLLRGRIRTDKDGLYRVETVMPGQYDLGEAKRPAHIHYKVSADACRSLTTQLYFKGDPWLSRDPFVRRSLIIELQKAAGTFDIVLAKA
jgi:protocatechuate 3,4-dioxygenase beta subunit